MSISSQIYVLVENIEFKAERSFRDQFKMSEVWGIERRVAAWNLLFDFTASLNNINAFGTSPFLITAYSYVSKLYRNHFEETKEIDLFVICITAAFITSKQFNRPLAIGSKEQLNTMITKFFTVVSQYEKEKKKILGSSTNKAKKDNVFAINEFRSYILNAELILLDAINWNFTQGTDNPFAYFIHWMIIMRKRIPGSSSQELDKFRQIRRKALHYLILLIVSYDLTIDLEEMNAAALQFALSQSSIHAFSADQSNDNFWANIIETDANPGNFIELSNTIPSLEETIQRFNINSKPTDV